MDVPIFFLCKGEKQYYITLCTDFDELTYVVAQLPLMDVYKLLHGEIPMRDVILKQREYWLVYSGDEVSQDQVEKHEMKDLDEDLLPEKDACFKILMGSIENYVEKFDKEIFAQNTFSISKGSVYLTEMSEISVGDILSHDISYSKDLLEWNVKECKDMKSFFYEENIENAIPERIISFSNMDIKGRFLTWKDVYENNIAAAS